ncbi:anaerobic carbon-monoxide dehydrogenase catalytic subunit [Desulfococcus multivorans]|uniref:Carbon monoxide dehydrogenase n=1 Tax=Desulfococcus multivorans DSM 2059 TaxID=1121405 RepID=S7UPC9_DESML|nr:anaerobic carbon-monoxide dehydrogenase catalytic subunit [Desulfococcus multivorans]AOY59854.1 CdhA: CO dehydrogenase, catalytic subunit [Desulfococcus multivorans]AQV02017.1 carbon-monoxide dehydrogenase catalytic subunit [Desulfococcus multivorans]EPR35854.1 carbon-monoxide dehydrogenase, catalytic subunit [Desulfococcus multivorans DSM 2059]SJZ34183.1 Ni-dependent carbon monoxide dehydrogenase precursor [Desulfococcus multivorans DSM 2059]
MAVVKKDEKAKVANPQDASIDAATQIMIKRAQDLGIDTCFDRNVTLKPCSIGNQGTCCKNCSMGPCRLPLPKDYDEANDTRKGICGATANTIAARNFIRMVAGGAAAHSDHGRSVAEVFLSAARKETDAYQIKDVRKLLEIAPFLGVATTVEKDGAVLDRDIDEIAVEVGEKAMEEWGKAEGELEYLKRAPKPRYELWKKQGVLPRNIDREIVEIMHRTHMGVDQDYKNLMKQGVRASIADGWGGSMLATDLQDILFGTPYPLASEANLGVLKEDHVNIVIHGHEPVLSEMIVTTAQKPEMVAYAKSKGAKGIQLSGICCTANEILQRHGVPLCGTFLQQELAIITGAVDAMVVDIQCIFQNVANVAKCFHTKLITTHPIAKMEQDNAIHIEFDEHHAVEDAEKIVRMAIDNFANRGAEVMIPRQKSPIIAGFGVESVEYHLGGTFRGSYYTLNDNIINGRIRGVAGVVGCNNARVKHNEGHITVVKELIKNDVLVLTTGCNAIACAMEGLLTPESAKVFCGPGLAEVCETVGIPPVLHLGSCVDNSRILLAATEVVKAGGLGNDISDLPVAGSAPEWMSEKAISIGQYVVASGIYTVFGAVFPTAGAPVFQRYLFEEMEKMYGGMWDFEADPVKHAWKMINHIDAKRKALGIDQARERVMMDFADRQALDV